MLSVTGHFWDLLVVDVHTDWSIGNVVVMVLFVFLEISGLVLIFLAVSLFEGIFLGGWVTVFTSHYGNHNADQNQGVKKSDQSKDHVWGACEEYLTYLKVDDASYATEGDN